MRDTYDFNADWFGDAAFGLGICSKRRVLSKKEMLLYKAVPLPLMSRNFPGLVPARNEGGDFFVFSDVMWLAPHVEYVYF